MVGNLYVTMPMFCYRMCVNQHWTKYDTNAYVHARTHARTQARTPTHVCVCMYVCICICVCLSAYVRICAYAYTYVCVCGYIYSGTGSEFQHIKHSLRLPTPINRNTIKLYIYFNLNIKCSTPSHICTCIHIPIRGIRATNISPHRKTATCRLRTEPRVNKYHHTPKQKTTHACASIVNTYTK